MEGTLHTQASENTESLQGAQVSWCDPLLTPTPCPSRWSSPAARWWWQSWQHPAAACPRWEPTQEQCLPGPEGGLGRGRVLRGAGSGTLSGDSRRVRRYAVGHPFFSGAQIPGCSPFSSSWPPFSSKYSPAAEPGWSSGSERPAGYPASGRAAPAPPGGTACR